MKGMLRAAEMLCLGALRTLEQPELIDKAKEELRRKNGGAYSCPLPEYVTPPASTMPIPTPAAPPPTWCRAMR